MLHFSFSAQALSSILLRYISLPCISLRPHKRLVRFCFATSHYRASHGIYKIYTKKESDMSKLISNPLFVYVALVLNAYIPACAATSAAKSSTFFSSPSPVSKRTNFLTVTLALFSFATLSTYFATVRSLS